MRAWFVTVAVVGSIAGCPAVSTTTFTDDPNATTVAFDTNLTATRTRTGTSTGVEFNSTCQGYFPATPNHTLTIANGLSMEIRVSGDAGVVVWLFGEGIGNFCVRPNEPLLRFWTRGDLNVYVGSETEGATVDYTLEFVPSS
ncbi:MAG: hypothetical protein D6744_14690 [Planctomycetota bacterium]|nr:MAG: hypothetical protein D6744_14690 [Planctomycetota bacterium]